MMSISQTGSPWLALDVHCVAQVEAEGQRRYLELRTGSPHRCWTIQGLVPRRRQDWKKDAGRHGGGQGDGVFKLRKPFLKRVVLEWYVHLWQ